MPLNPKNQWWKNVIKKLPEKYKNYCGISNITTSILKLISVKKDIYHKRLTRKLADPLTRSKTYWFILKPFNNNKKLSNSGCNPVNCLSQTRRNLTTEYLNLNFVTTPKLKPLHSSYAGKVFISCVWLIPVLQVSTRPSLSDSNILQPILWDWKFSTRLVPIDIFN